MSHPEITLTEELARIVTYLFPTTWGCGIGHGTREGTPMWQNAADWAESEFRGMTQLGERFEQRLVAVAGTLAARPDGTLPQRFDWAELKAAYRLIHAAAPRPDDLQAVHRTRTRERAVACPGPVLFVHDTTQLDFSSHRAVADQLGPIGDGAESARGFLQHNSLAVDPTGSALLGLIHQQTFVRTAVPAGETRAARYRRPDRESAVWERGIEAVGRPPKGACWVHVGDRGADCYAAMATAVDTGAHFLIRLCQDRRATTADDSLTHLMVAARAVTPIASGTVAVASRGGRPGRTAAVVLGSVRVSIRPPHAEVRWRGRPPLGVTVVRIWEPNPPPDVEPLEWVLGTDRAGQTAADLQKYQEWYEWRWATAEEYHKVQKTGCRIEAVRFETRGRLQAAIALLSVVAVRVLALRWQRDATPDAAVEEVASAAEIAAVSGVSRRRPRTVREFVDAVAQLGGYLGRRCDGPPGWQSLWRGYQRLADIVLGLELAHARDPAQPQVVGNR